MDLILASTSPYRRELLARLGIAFRSVSPGVDEDVVKQAFTDPIAIAEHLARAKAEAVASKEPGAVVIGSDQLVAFEGLVLGKPETPERAVEQLLLLAGREHRLITSVAVVDAHDTEVFTDVTTLRLRPLTPEEAARYVEADRPMDCAGSYKIESLGIALFDRIDCHDFTAIVGLPLLAVCRMLRSRGFAIP